jgi:hypothetical protein
MPRDSLIAWLVALPAALMLAAGSVSAMPLTAILCNGGSAELPGGPDKPDCDKACHAGCQRRRGGRA